MTGYTHYLISKDLDFHGWALTCARAMGACIMMRDDDMDAPIPERFEPSDWNAKKLIETEAEVARLSAMSESELLVLGERLRREAIAYHEKELAADKPELVKMREMLAETEAWTPPTPDHQGLKDFMVQQLRDSIEHDTMVDYHTKAFLKATAKTAAQYAAEKVLQAKQSVEYHTREHAEEVRRTESRNDWLKRLRESLPQPAPA